jgi:hypothetical protein
MNDEPRGIVNISVGQLFAYEKDLSLSRKYFEVLHCSKLVQIGEVNSQRGMVKEEIGIYLAKSQILPSYRHIELSIPRQDLRYAQNLP